MVTVRGIIDRMPHRAERNNTVIIRKTTRKLPRKAIIMPRTILPCQTTLM